MLLLKNSLSLKVDNICKKFEEKKDGEQPATLLKLIVATM